MLVYCLPWRMTERESRVLGPALDPDALLLGPARVNCSESRYRKQPRLHFYSSSCSCSPCQKHRPTMDYAISQLLIMDPELKRKGAEKNWKRHSTSGAAGWEVRSLGLPSCPAGWLRICSSSKSDCANNQIGLWVAKPTYLCSILWKGEVLTKGSLLGVT